MRLASWKATLRSARFAMFAPAPRSSIILALLALFALDLRADAPKEAPASVAGRSLDSWVKDLGADNPLVREEALEILLRLGPEAKPVADAIRPLLKDSVATTQVRAALALW